MAPCIFNLKEDPCEMINIANSEPLLIKSLENLLLKYDATAVAPSNVPNDERANPFFWGNLWVNWQDPHPMEFSFCEF